MNKENRPEDKNDTSIARKSLERKAYERELERLHVELVKLQEWVKTSGAKICILFEGRDGAGKGGTIKAITERVSPRTFHVIALSAPTEREKSQMYIQRYLRHLPAGGEIVIFDRSWYNRAGVERVMEFCTEKEAQTFLNAVPSVEKAIVDFGSDSSEVLAGGEPGGTDAAFGGAHQGRQKNLEAVTDGPEILQPLARLLQSAG